MAATAGGEESVWREEEATVTMFARVAQSRTCCFAFHTLSLSFASIRLHADPNETKSLDELPTLLC